MRRLPVCAPLRALFSEIQAEVAKLLPSPERLLSELSCGRVGGNPFSPAVTKQLKEGCEAGLLAAVAGAVAEVPAMEAATAPCPAAVAAAPQWVTRHRRQARLTMCLPYHWLFLSLQVVRLSQHQSDKG